MKFVLAETCPKVDVLFLALFEKEKLSTQHKKALGKETTAALEARMKAKDFEGKQGQNLSFYPEKAPAKKVVILGRGDKEKALPQATEQLGGSMAGMSKGKKHVAVWVEAKDLSELSFGFVLGSYEFSRYKKRDPKASQLEAVTFVSSINQSSKTHVEHLKRFMEASNLTRDLINTPAGDLNTQDLVNEAKAVAKKYKLKITVFDAKKLESMGCGGLIGVGKGAKVGPSMVILEYKHKSTSKVPDLALVGKGIVFDTGGLNLKPTGYMETMKQDMAGAATVLGALQIIADAKLPGYFIAVMCCAENAISDQATHPGDVLKAYNGKTIEVTNTDAEGRLVLADGLSYTEAKFKPKAMINIATLTGAVSVALGYHITGVMGNNQKLVDDVLKASLQSHERAWQLPLDDDFVKATEGSFTDLKNSTDGVRAGSSMGGAFLKNFVEKTPWVHFDIGGTAWAEKPSATTKYGSTAAALRTLYALAASRSH